MKIALVIASLGGGGAERIVLSLARGLREGGDDAHVLCLDSDCALEVHEDTPVHVLSGLRGTASVLQKVMSGLGQLLRLRATARREGYSHYVAHMERANILLVLCSALFPDLFPRNRCVLTVHNHLQTSLARKSPFKRFASRLLYRHAARKGFKVVCVSELARDNARKLFGFAGENISVIPNFIPVADIARSAEAPPGPLPPSSGNASGGKPLGGSPDGLARIFESPVILSVGRLSPQKGQVHLVRAFARIVEQCPEARLVIFGQGELEQPLRAQIKSLGLEDRVHLPGFVSDPFPWIHRADVFVMPSLYEGMPMILLEALACSAAIVCTDCPSGPREILAPDTDPEQVAADVERLECGVLTPPLSARRDEPSADSLSFAEEALCRAIIPFLTKREDAVSLRRAARDHANRFDVGAGAARWRDLLASLEQSPNE